jgi:hypothetical protein
MGYTTTIADYILDQLWGFATANVLKNNIQNLVNRQTVISSVNTGQTVTGTTLTDLTNLSVTITTSGRPIFIGCLPSIDMNASYFSCSKNGTNSVSGISATIAILRDGVDLSHIRLNHSWNPADTSTSHNYYVPAGAVQHIDVSGEGTYTFKLQGSAGSVGNDALNVQYIRLVAFEI